MSRGRIPRKIKRELGKRRSLRLRNSTNLKNKYELTLFILIECQIYKKNVLTRLLIII